MLKSRVKSDPKQGKLGLKSKFKPSFSEYAISDIFCKDSKEFLKGIYNHCKKKS